MKTVAMDRDFNFVAKSTLHIRYSGGKIYPRVPEAQAKAIVAAHAGRIVEQKASAE